MRDVSLKQRIRCIIRILIFGPFSARKKCALYTGKYGRSKFIIYRLIINPHNNQLPVGLIF